MGRKVTEYDKETTMLIKVDAATRKRLMVIAGYNVSTVREAASYVLQRSTKDVVAEIMKKLTEEMKDA